MSLGIKNPDELDVSLATVMDAVIDDETLPEGAGILHHEESVDLLPSDIELSGIRNNYADAPFERQCSIVLSYINSAAGQNRLI